MSNKGGKSKKAVEKQKHLELVVSLDWTVQREAANNQSIHV